MSVRPSKLGPSAQLTVACTRSVAFVCELAEVVAQAVDEVPVIAGAAVHRVVAGTTAEKVIARTAYDPVAAVVAIEGVVAVAAIDRVVAAHAGYEVVAVQCVEVVVVWASRSLSRRPMCP